MRRYIAFIIILFSSWTTLAAEGDSKPTFQLSGDVSLLSHYVEYGISQSDKSPALQGSFWFNLGPQFRLGLWGSNTNYETGNDHFNLRLNADIIVTFSQNARMYLSYSQSQFYNGGEHNGNITGLHLEIGDYRFLYDSLSNWEATNYPATRFAFGKVTPVFGTWTWNNELGYDTLTLPSYNNYFDLKTGLGTKWGVLFFEGALTATSESSQFNGRGDVFFILSAKKDL